jgi:hypothetical protein
MSEPKEVITGLTDKDRIGEVACHWFSIYDLDPKYRTLLLESEANKRELEILKATLFETPSQELANAKKAKAWDELEKWLLNEKEIDFDERDFIGPVSVLDKMSELMKEKP